MKMNNMWNVVVSTSRKVHELRIKIYSNKRGHGVVLVGVMPVLNGCQVNELRRATEDFGVPKGQVHGPGHSELGLAVGDL